MNFESVRSIIDTYIKKNGVEAITGDILNNVLNTMLDDVDTAISSIEPSPGGGGGGTADLSNYYTKAQSDARYLALSGGEINGSGYIPFSIKSNDQDAVGIRFIGYDGRNGHLLYGGDSTYLVTDNGWYNTYTLIHSGNIGSYAFVPKSEIINNTEADYLLTNGVYLNATGNGGGNSNFPSSYSVFLTFSQSSKYAAQISIGNNAIHMRRKIDTWGHWMRIIAENENGNVGIGTTSPLSKLQVGGQINVSHNSNKNYAFISQDDYTSNTSWMKLGTCYGYQTEAVAMTIYNGMVKIGNAIPTCELDVNGGIKATKPIFGYMYGTHNNAAAFIFDKPGSNYTGIGSDGVSDTIRFGACNVQGGWVDYNQKWKFYGDVIVTGDFSFGSDIRFKDKIEDMGISIADIAKAPLFIYKWNNREDDTIYLGSSAQYWEKIAPWLVSGDDFKSLNYATLGVAMGISLAKKTINHEERIKILEAEIKRLKREQYGS